MVHGIFFNILGEQGGTIERTFGKIFVLMAAHVLGPAISQACSCAPANNVLIIRDHSRLKVLEYGIMLRCL
jgi:hypothetical protein